MKQSLLNLFFCLCIGSAMAQSPGIIVRPAAGIGVTPLNPNGDGFSSATDMTGREMYKMKSILSTGNNTISLNPSASLAKGLYILQVIAGNEVVWSQRIQKAK